MHKNQATYSAPTLTEIGSVRNLTQGDIADAGQDKYSWVNLFLGFNLIGS